MTTRKRAPKAPRTLKPYRPRRSLSSKQLKQSRSRRTKLGLAIIILATVAVLGGLYTVHAVQRQPSLPNPYRIELRDTTDFALYYPGRLPDGFTAGDAVVNQSGLTIAQLQIHNTAGITLLLTQRKQLADFSYDSFYAGLQNKQQFSVASGQATIGQLDNGATKLASLITKDGTWIIVQAPSSVSNDTLREILRDLRSDPTGTHRP